MGTGVAEVPSTYENYTPVPSAPPLAAPPMESNDDVPGPPLTRSVPNGSVDYFEPAQAPGAASFNR